MEISSERIDDIPLISATLEGNGADDPLYFPTWQQMAKVIGHKNFVFIADCKAALAVTLRHGIECPISTSAPTVYYTEPL